MRQSPKLERDREEHNKSPKGPCLCEIIQKREGVKEKERRRERGEQLFQSYLVKLCGSHDFQYIYNNATQHCYLKTKN